MSSNGIGHLSSTHIAPLADAGKDKIRYTRGGRESRKVQRSPAVCLAWLLGLSPSVGRDAEPQEQLYRRCDMQSWYGLWMNHSAKHQELLREAERERLFNKLRAALQAAASPKRAQTLDDRARDRLAPDRLRPAER